MIEVPQIAPCSELSVLPRTLRGCYHSCCSAFSKTQCEKLAVPTSDQCARPRATEYREIAPIPTEAAHRSSGKEHVSKQNDGPLLPRETRRQNRVHQSLTALWNERLRTMHRNAWIMSDTDDVFNSIAGEKPDGPRQKRFAIELDELLGNTEVIGPVRSVAGTQNKCPSAFTVLHTRREKSMLDSYTHTSHLVAS